MLFYFFPETVFDTMRYDTARVLFPREKFRENFVKKIGDLFLGQKENVNYIRYLGYNSL